MLRPPTRPLLLLLAAALAAGTLGWFFAGKSDAPVAITSAPTEPAPSPSRVPEVAIEDVLRLPPEQRRAAAQSLLIAVADQPDRAKQLARRLCAEDLALARDHGNTLITILTATGQYDAALEFAAAGGPERAEWLHRLLGEWARADPATAVQAALQQPGAEGLPEVAKTWASRDPIALANYAVNHLADTERTLALAAALPVWIERDPAAAALWLTQVEPRAELDSSLIALAQVPALQTRFPDLTLAWAANIVDPELRVRTLTQVVSTWATIDAPAAERSLVTHPSLAESERRELIALVSNRAR